MRRIPIIMLLLVALPVLAQEQDSVTPDQLWKALLQGNLQFVSGTVSYDRLVEERRLFSRAQMPPVTVLSCSDSRVPPELAFNQSLGALFVIRSAGNTADEYGIASIEYAIAHGWTKLLVVLAHERCGAVAACLATGDPDTPSLRALATRIALERCGDIAHRGRTSGERHGHLHAAGEDCFSALPEAGARPCSQPRKRGAACCRGRHHRVG